MSKEILRPQGKPAPAVGKFAKFTDGIWREVTEGSAGVPLYNTPPAAQPEQEPINDGWQITFANGHSGELVGELIGYKKIVADQDALLLRNAERIIDLQTHIANLEGEA